MRGAPSSSWHAIHELDADSRHNTVTARVDLSAIRHNLSVVKSLCPRSRVMAMVKADAYGHGLIPVARALKDADGLAVARLKEALLLRRAGVSQRILLLSTYLDAGVVAECAAFDIDVTVHDMRSLQVVAGMIGAHPIRVWLKLDSGMHRAGLDPVAFIEADRRLASSPGVREVTHMTHFSSSDDMSSEMTSRQIRCFFDCHQVRTSAASSLANSAALISRPDVRTEWVRPGIMLYGCNPLSMFDLKLRPAMSMVAKVVAVRWVSEGEAVGYNGTWIACRRSRIALLGAGYGDGYPRQARTGTPVRLNNAMVPVVGRVSMDSLSVDATECADVAVGDEALLWGDRLPASDVAAHAETINYDILTGVSQRVSREYA